MDNISSSTLLFGVAIATAVMLLVLLVSSPSSSVVAPLARFWATLVGRVRLAFDCYCYNNNPTNSYNWSSGWIRSSAGSTGSSINSINISSIGKNTVIQVSALFVHPVKSLGGIPCQSTVLDSKGIIGDRRYMLVTPSPLPLCGSFGPNEATHRFLTQRHCPVLARVRVAIGPTQQNKEDNGSGPQQKQMVFTVNLPNSTNNSSFVSTKCTIHAQPAPNAPLYRASVWGDACLVQDMGDAVADFFQRVLTSSSSSGDDNDNGTQFSSVRCVMQHETDDRTAKDRFVPPAARTLLMGRNPSVSLADGFPLLIASESSLAELNRRLLEKGKEPLPMSRFRPNIVLRGGNSLPPFAEDYMRVIQIMEKNDPTKRKGIFHVVSSCARCKQSCTDQKTGRVTEEPVATMRDFRRLNPKEPEAVYFAVNAIPAPGSEGCPIDVGDIIQVLQWGNPTWGDP